MSKIKKYKDESRKDWGTEEKITIREIELGAILRIADACEVMTKDRVNLEETLQYYKNRHKDQLAEIDTLIRSRNSYKGKYLKLKKDMEEQP